MIGALFGAEKSGTSLSGSFLEEVFDAEWNPMVKSTVWSVLSRSAAQENRSLALRMLAEDRHGFVRSLGPYAGDLLQSGLVSLAGSLEGSELDLFRHTLPSIGLPPKELQPALDALPK